ncbi:MAG: class I SAM-dependent methyltransferase [Burkholderiaceae bacterium]
MDSRPATDPWNLGHPYERYVGRWSRLVAPRFLSWLDVPAGRRWLDLGCGTGALAAAIAVDRAPAAVIGVEPSDGFLQVARGAVPPGVDLRQGGAESIPVADGSVDVVVSGLVLNFIADLDTALGEVRRVAARGALFGAYVWDYADGMEMMRHFWDAASELDPRAAALDEGIRFPLCRPEMLRSALERAGFGAVDTAALDIVTAFTNFDDYWLPFLGGQGPAPGYAMSLDDGTRERLREAIRERLPIGAEGSIRLGARAWAVRAAIEPAVPAASSPA